MIPAGPLLALAGALPPALWALGADAAAWSGAGLLCASAWALRKRRSLPAPVTGAPPLAGSVVAPVDGRVLRARRNAGHPVLGAGASEVAVSAPWWRSGDVRLPADCAVEDIDPDGGPGTSLVLVPADGRGGPLVLTLPRRPGAGPDLAVAPGDRGEAGAGVGVLPLGGTVLLHVPGDREVLVAEGDALRAGRTPVAGPAGLPRDPAAGTMEP